MRSSHWNRTHLGCGRLFPAVLPPFSPSTPALKHLCSLADDSTEMKNRAFSAPRCWCRSVVAEAEFVIHYERRVACDDFELKRYSVSGIRDIAQVSSIGNKIVSDTQTYCMSVSACLKFAPLGKGLRMPSSRAPHHFYKVCTHARARA
jgi:hypothetical protein